MLPESHDAEIPTGRDPYAAFRFGAYRNYFTGGFVSVIGRQMLAVSIGWEIYERTNSKTALGLVGLMGALPVILLSLPAGHIADRLSRKWIIIISQCALVLTSLSLAWLSLGHTVALPVEWAQQALATVAAWFGEKEGVSFGPEVPLIYGLLLVNGTARAFGWAARTPFLTGLVPRSVLPNAVTWNSSNFEIGSMTGPALGGLLLAKFSFPFVYALDACCQLAFIAFLLPTRSHQEPHAPTGEHPLRDLLAGMRFVWNTKVILATITLDLFAVLLGGAIALLPVFAKEILHVGPLGLGWLRAAPSIGAVSMALIIAHRPPMQRAGVAMLWAVAAFGVATVVFGLSHSFWLSLLALAVTGAADNISVVVRHTLVQLLTPDQMRGRVAAVNNIFIGSSNELGALESGLTAALFGPVLSVVGGGIGTILAVAAVAWKWPQVRRIGTLARAGGQEDR
jgi:MFS family permease